MMSKHRKTELQKRRCRSHVTTLKKIAHDLKSPCKNDTCNTGAQGILTTLEDVTTRDNIHESWPRGS